MTLIAFFSITCGDCGGEIAKLSAGVEPTSSSVTVADILNSLGAYASGPAAQADLVKQHVCSKPKPKPALRLVTGGGA